MYIETITDIQYLESHEDQWLALLEQSITNTIFQTPAFLKSWWQTYGTGELQLLLIKTSTHELVGIAPFQLINRGDKRVLTFIGDVNITDYQDLIIHQDHRDAIYDCVSKYLVNDLSRYDFVELFSVPEYSPTRTHLLLNARTEKQQEVCPIIELPHHWDAYLESLDRKQRHEVRRKIRKLTENLSYQFYSVDNHTLDSQPITDFINLHHASSMDKALFWNEKRISFFHLFLTELARKSWLKLFFLKIDDTLCATMLIFDYNNQYQLYNSGYLPDIYREYSTGQVLTSLTIQEAIKNSKSRYNFLRGSEEYKFRLGGKAEPIFDLTFQ